MRLAEYCDTSSSYIGEIEIGRKFPSIEMVEKIASALRIEPYHLFVDRKSCDSGPENTYPLLPNAMKTEIKDEVYSAINDILNRY